MNPHQFFTSVAIGVVAVTAACAARPTQVSTPNTPGVTSAQKMDATIVASLLADAKCTHAAECNAIGTDLAYATRDACIAATRGKAEDELGEASCPHGIDASLIEACVTEVSTESCTGFTSGLGRSTCQTVPICP
jgi:hypothetical protein